MERKPTITTDDEQKALPPWKAFLILIAILAAIAAIVIILPRFYTPSSPNRLVYNYFEFQKIGGAWHTNWQRGNTTYDVSLRYSPLEVENVSVSGTGLNDTFMRQPFYLTFDPDDNSTNFQYLALTMGELGLNLVRGLGAQIQIACTKNISDACEAHPIITCADDQAVWYIRSANETKVLLQGNCIIIQGNELELVKAADRVLYHFYKIMP
jgi:hypothetical protein